MSFARWKVGQFHISTPECEVVSRVFDCLRDYENTPVEVLSDLAHEAVEAHRDNFNLYAKVM